MKFDLHCAKHPNYKAEIFSPRTSCEACMTLYWLRTDGFRLMPDGGELRVAKPAKTRKKRDLVLNGGYRN